MDNSVKNDSEEISIKEVALKITLSIKYLLSKWVIIFFAGIIGGMIGFTYAYLKRSVYTATTTFVLEDSKGGAMGQYSGLASLAGIDISGGGAGGIFQGDNIMELYQSRIMIQKTLLSPVVIKGKKQLLIDRYIDFNKLRDKWKEEGRPYSVSFNGNPESFRRDQNAIVTDMVGTFKSKILKVDKLDKKFNILKVEVTTSDELFSKEFNNKLVETVNNFYTETKTKKSSQTVKILQKQADSVKRILNNSIGGVASAVDAAPNANPALLSLRVPSQKKQIDVQTNTAIYSEIVKNLEVSKLALLQEAPLIQVIDKPVLPLPVANWSIWKGIFLFGFLGIFLAIGILSSYKLYCYIIR